MTQDILSEFSTGWTTDNHLAAMSVRAGALVDQAEIIDLCSGARCLFSLVTLCCRVHERVSDCYHLGTDTLESFRKAQAAWGDISIDGPATAGLRFYLMQLHRLCDLAEASPCLTISFVSH
jgi:hypothetical protein